MGHLVISGLAALLAASTAQAQTDWIFVSCEVELQIHNGAARSETRLYRFNETDIDEYQPEALVSWRNWCQASDNPLRLDSMITVDQVSQHRVYEAPDGRRRQTDFTINRITGRYFYMDDDMRPSGQFHETGSGQCAPTTDPTAGLRRF